MSAVEDTGREGRPEDIRAVPVKRPGRWLAAAIVLVIAVAAVHSIVTNPRFDYLHEQAGRFVEKLGGKTALNMARKAEEAAKSILWPSVIFEELGLKYYGPIDGHDIATL